jgi:hypothetical protein
LPNIVTEAGTEVNKEVFILSFFLRRSVLGLWPADTPSEKYKITFEMFAEGYPQDPLRVEDSNLEPNVSKGVG